MVGMNEPHRQATISRTGLAFEGEFEEVIHSSTTTYHVGKEIGHGAYGVVYRGVDINKNQLVALKRFALSRIDEDVLANAEAEINLMQRLCHQNIVKYIDTVRTKGYLYIVLELVDSGSLLKVIKSHPPLNERVAAAYTAQVLEGLSYLHEQGVLHRDIKAANILSTANGLVKLADFGLAIALSDDDVTGATNSTVHDTNPGGSPFWMAPEIIELAPPTSGCDIWSVGCMVIELITGRPPYYNYEPMAALYHIVHDPMPALPDGISSSLSDFLRCCFRKDPAMRPSAATLRVHAWLSPSKHANTTTYTLVDTPILQDRYGGNMEAFDTNKVDECVVNTVEKFETLPPFSASETHVHLSGANNLKTNSNDNTHPTIRMRGALPLASSSLEWTRQQSTGSMNIPVNATNISQAPGATSSINETNGPRLFRSVRRVASIGTAGSSSTINVVNIANNVNTSASSAIDDRFNCVTHENTGVGLSSASTDSFSIGSSNGGAQFDVNNVLDNRHEDTMPEVSSVLIAQMQRIEETGEREKRERFDMFSSSSERETSTISVNVSETMLVGDLSNFNSTSMNVSKATLSRPRNGPLRSPNCSNSLTTIGLSRGNHLGLDALTQPLISFQDKDETDDFDCDFEETSEFDSAGLSNLLLQRMTSTTKAKESTEQVSATNGNKLESFGNSNTMMGGTGRWNVGRGYECPEMIEFDEDDFTPSAGRDFQARVTRDLVEKMSQIKRCQTPEELEAMTNHITSTFEREPIQRDLLISHFGVMSIIDMFDAPISSTYHGSHTRKSRHTQNGANGSSGNISSKLFAYQFLRISNAIMEGNIAAQEQLSLLGIIPTVLRIFERSCKSWVSSRALTPFSPNTPSGTVSSIVNTINTASVSTGSEDPISGTAIPALPIEAVPIFPSPPPPVPTEKEIPQLTTESAKFIHQISLSSTLTLQMLIGAGGLPTITLMVSFGSAICPPQRHSMNSETSSRTSSNTISNIAPLPSPTEKCPPSTIQPISSGSGLSVVGSGSAEGLSVNSGDGSNNPRFAVNLRVSTSFLTSYGIDGSLHTEPLTAPATNVQSTVTQTVSPLQPIRRTHESAMRVFIMGIDCIQRVLHVRSNRQRDFYRVFSKLELQKSLAIALNNLMSLLIEQILTGSGPYMKFSKSQSRVGTNSTSSSSTPRHSPTGHLSAGGSFRHSMSNLRDFNTVQSNSGGSPGESIDVVTEYATKVASLLSDFSSSDVKVSQSLMKSDTGVLTVILSILSAPELRGEPPSIPESTSTSNGTGSNNNSLRRSLSVSSLTGHAGYVEIIKMLVRCLKNLSFHSSVVDEFDNASVLEHLIPLLNGPLADHLRNYILPSVFNLCRINRRRQELATHLGIIPHLQKVISEGSPLRQFALPIFCDLAHTSNFVRTKLAKHDAVVTYVDLLISREEYWQEPVVTSLAAWSTSDQSSEMFDVLVSPPNLSKFIEFFRNVSPSTIAALHKPLLDLHSSARFARSLSCSGIYLSTLVTRLRESSTENQALATRSLLKITQLIHRHHASPRQMMLDYDLYAIAHDLAIQGDRVLVGEQASRLLLDAQHSTLS